MTSPIWANNASTTLAAPITNTTTTLTLLSGSGTLFPNPGAGQEFSITLISATNPLTMEIVYCTARSGDACTIVRAQEGTTALAWNAGDTAANFVTEGLLVLLANNIATLNATVATAQADITTLQGNLAGTLGTVTQYTPTARVLNTAYPNTTGFIMFVSAVGLGSANANFDFVVTGPATPTWRQGSVNSGDQVSCGGPVPAGASYTITNDVAGVTLQTVTEWTQA